jgi:hypothetical protein
METPFRAASLAVLGRRDEALSAMEAVMADAKDPHGSDHVQMDVYTALGEYGTLIEVLWPRWLERDSGAPGVELHLDEKLALAAALQHTGAADRAEAILAAAYERIRRQSPLHSGNYLIGQASYATVSGDHPQAVSYLATLAARGNPGMGIYGTPFRYAWFVEGDDRYQDVFEQLTANRAAQVAQLRRMREQAYTPAQVREGYLARHSASATEP